ncbi:Histamine H2 receptor [Exaiptasia diaphana]|nr:Histamine H2 receptor [Exaiptasia diaphana]
MDHNGSLYNKTDDEEEVPLGFDAIVDTLPIILAILIIITNGVVFVLFGKNHRLRNITNTFLIFWRFTGISTVLHLLVVTLDRYAAIVHAIRYRTIVTRTRACIAIITVWSLAGIAALVQLSWPTTEEAEQRKMSEDEMQDIHTTIGVYQSVTIGVFFALPLFVMIFCYIRIFYVVRYHEKQIKRQNLPSDLTIRKQSAFDIPAQWKSAIVFIVMTVLYVIFWFPYFFYEPLQELAESSLPAWVEYVFFYYPRFMTSFTNPIIYIVGKHDFRKALRPRKNKQNGSYMTSLITRGRSSQNMN